MKRVACIFALALNCLAAAAQIDSTLFRNLDNILEQYYGAIAHEPLEIKCGEMDFLIAQCKDSVTRQYVAQRIYSHYVDAPVMGEEAVAIHIFDKWYAGGDVRMQNDIDELNARIFVDFNRNSLIGMDAPILTMRKPSGKAVTIPVPGKTTILYFYDTGCSKCKAETILLPSALKDVDFNVEFLAICTGTDRDAWRQWRRKKFNFRNRNVKVTHLWDPEIDSDYQKQYGVIITPRIFIVEPQGSIIGRRLELDSMVELLKYASIIQTEYDKHIKNK